MLPFPHPLFAPGVAAVITQLSNTIIRAIEQEQIVERLESSEQRAETEGREAA